ncbi:quercetin 2,3-dioxygenase [Kineococcus rhizosphaerae]|uniref:Quercetin 2,3-dioxygenase n=1 Tax=Kineococcus rhizosphaerae TaxID=559628 RepID=A0A2T0QP59_9ACTN|nr:quercetin 2,3-dioxygenase [Kineococcus rhizosphaerae]PRY06443.1 quercetin 2,3-dioxygenase [Kineococcus rhizosphaerae]
MTYEYLSGPDGGPAWSGVLPGAPRPYFLSRGEGEHANLFGDLFTLLVSGEESEGGFGVFTSLCPSGELIPTHSHGRTHEVFYVLEGAVRLHVQDADGHQSSRVLRTGDFGFVPAGLPHAYQVMQAARLLGVVSGGFERFPQRMGTPTDSLEPQPPFVPEIAHLLSAAKELDLELHPGFTWDTPQGLDNHADHADRADQADYTARADTSRVEGD